MLNTLKSGTPDNKKFRELKRTIIMMIIVNIEKKKFFIKEQLGYLYFNFIG
tara:strand:- start:58 stop:210 length:153 start_codon:yes stop_codon:yes gene_type:complete